MYSLAVAGASLAPPGKTTDSVSSVARASTSASVTRCRAGSIRLVGASARVCAFNLTAQRRPTHVAQQATASA